MSTLVPKHRPQLSQQNVSVGQNETVYWGHANYTWIGLTDWNKLVATHNAKREQDAATPVEKEHLSNAISMEQDLRKLFAYDLGQKRELQSTIAALQEQKYATSNEAKTETYPAVFDDLPFVLQICLGEWAEHYSGPLFTRAKAKRFAEQWHYLLTAPGWDDVRQLPDPRDLLQSSLESMRVLSQDTSVNPEHFQKWVHDTLALAPVQWVELRKAALAYWEAMEPQDRMTMDRDWAIQYDLCPDEVAFLSYTHRASGAAQSMQVAVEKPKRFDLFSGMFGGL